MRSMTSLILRSDPRERLEGRTGPTRRPLLGLLLLAPLALAGCGWEPLYADRATGPGDAELRAIQVAPIAERIGQRLTIGLRESLNPDGVPTPQRYLLRTTLEIYRADLGVITQGLGTRGRLDVYANYALSDIMTGKPVLGGRSHAAESFDILANEYSNVVAEDDARTRAVEELRRDMLAQLTLFVQRRVAAAKP
jgi:LPS-assembly lipoprotein